MLWLRQTRDDIPTRPALGLLPLATLSRTPVVQELLITLTINAHGLECRRVFQDENSYRFGHELRLSTGTIAESKPGLMLQQG